MAHRSQAKKFGTKTDSVIIRDSTTITRRTKKPERWNVGVGLNIQGNRNRFDFGPKLSLELDRWAVGYGYNVLNKTHQIRLTRKFRVN